MNTPDRLELARAMAWDELSRKCTDADMESLLALADRLAFATGPKASWWLLQLSLDHESAERMCILLATAIGELRCRREEIRQNVEGN